MPDETERSELAEMRATIDTLHLRLTSLEGVLRNMSARLAAVEYPAQQAYVQALPRQDEVSKLQHAFDRLGIEALVAWHT